MASLLEQLQRETVVSVSALQRNPSAALAHPIVRVMRGSKALGVFISTEQLAELAEDRAMLRAIAEVQHEPLLTLNEARAAYRTARHKK
jgi:hypothetical protein